MYRLWDVAIAPVLRAARATRVVEIGAYRGETTVLMLQHLGPDAEVHVIDPAPEFDPTEHEKQFPGRYVFHRDTSHNVLPGLGPVDAALVDGDHNWYTVHRELELLAAASRDAGQPLPVLLMHDVGWPYGRRDLYYDPEVIPAEYRQEYAQAGMRPDRRDLLEKGGLNPTMYNAVVEGGARNGVMTALDDFKDGYERPLRVVYLPVYYGLAIVVEQSRLDANPDLVGVLEHLESAEGRLELMEVTEAARLQAMIFQHNVYYPGLEKLARASDRYLRLLKGALLDEHYLENEVRLQHFTDRAASGRTVDAVALRDPVRHDKDNYARVLRERFGKAGPDETAAASFLPYTAMGRTRLDHLERCLDELREAGVRGDFAESGCGRGGGAIFMRAYLDAHEIPGRQVWVADRFRASPEPDRAPSLPRNGVAGFQADLNIVRDGFARFDLLDARVRFLQGPPAATLEDAPIERLALLRIGRQSGVDTRATLEALYDKITPGGYVIVEGHDDPVCAKEIAAFRAERGIESLLRRIDHATVAWRTNRTHGKRTGSVEAASPERAPLAPYAPPSPSETVDLSVVIVFYNMRREAERTLRALSRAYQEGIDDISYEVIVLENGSNEDELLGEEFVSSFGPEFRYVDLGDDAQPSPVFALNHGVAIARGNALALMIDGAHVVTPGVLRFGLAGLRTYEPAIVATQQWYIGPGQQSDAMDNGYDQAYEDRLFESISWPSAGYRLFEIGQFLGDRDWLDGVWESNCMFVTRELLAQIGAFDESFSVAGGGYANLELYERLGSQPGLTVATMIGEASFHQLHGGTTTNQPDATERRARVHGYSQTYAGMRGRQFKGPGKPLHYVGRIESAPARRTKPRRMSSARFDDAARLSDYDGRPESATPVPQELRSAFTEAVWRSLPWTRTTWLGRRIESAPTDLLALQEMIVAVRPDWIVETGTGDGGRALFLASMCDLVGHGEVLSVDGKLREDLPQHPRLRYLEGRAEHRDTARRVRDVVGDGRAVVVLGSRTDRYKTTREFEEYHGLVPVGSYVVIAETIVNGNPVWPAFGPGPAESVKQVLAAHGEFVADPLMEKYSLTFNPGGFLRRVR